MNDTPASHLLFNWVWWRLSQWIEFLDELELNQIPDSTDYKKVKTEDLTSNRVDFDKLDGVTTTKTEVNQLSGVNVGGNLTGDILTTDDTQTLTDKTLTSPKLNEDVVLSATATELNLLDGVTGLAQADFTKLAAINADATELNQLNGVTVGGSSAGDIVTINASQTLTTKTIDANNNTISNLAHGAEVDDPAVAHGATGAVVGTTNTQELTNKTLTSPEINENVVLIATSTEIDAAVAASAAILGDGTAGRILRAVKLVIKDGTDADTIKCELISKWNGDTISVVDNIAKNSTVGDFSLSSSGSIITIESTGITGNCVATISESIGANDTASDVRASSVAFSNDIQVYFKPPTGSSAQDLTTILSGSLEIWIFITYLTDV